MKMVESRYGASAPRAVFAAAAVGMILLGFSSVEAQQVCGGIAGTPCVQGEFCRLDDGACCCDFLGVCEVLPQGCPAIYDPVCGCDGFTYSSRCHASMAGVSVNHTGPCTGTGPGVTGVQINSLSLLQWNHAPGSVGYNIYVQGAEIQSPVYEGRCLYSAFPETFTLVRGDPQPGEAWFFQVTALYESGEGTMGHPRAPCTCTLPVDVGPCDGLCPRWYFNPSTGVCEEFVWGCCQGNANNFATREACEASCQDPCRMPASIGPCAAAIPRWYHNVLTGSCELFAWGGCGGNTNNFTTAAGCESACVP